MTYCQNVDFLIIYFGVSLLQQHTFVEVKSKTFVYFYIYLFLFFVSIKREVVRFHSYCHLLVYYLYLKDVCTDNMHMLCIVQIKKILICNKALVCNKNTKNFFFF